MIFFTEWKRVATLSSQEDINAILTNQFLTAAKDSGIDVVTSETFQGSSGADTFAQLESIKSKGIFLSKFGNRNEFLFRVYYNFFGGVFG